MRRFLSILLATFSLGIAVPVAAQEAKPTHVLLILADDLAWADLGCYGHPWHRTPNLDRLAAEGMRFSQAYAPAPICSASRAAILTGKTPARLNFEFVTKNEPGFQPIDATVPLRPPAFTLDLPLEEVTLAEMLSPAGYPAAFFGKWHVSRHHGGYLGWSPTHGPPAQGFGIAVEDFGAHPYAWRKEGRPEPITEHGVFPEDSLIAAASSRLAENADANSFSMVSQFHVHTPVETACQWLIDDYDERIPADVAQRERRVTYAAFIEELDHQVGGLLDAVDAAGLFQRTLVVFLSDNGGHPEYTANAPLRGSKWNLYEGGIRVPMIVRWPGRIAPGITCDVPVTGCDLLPTFADLLGADLPGDIDGRSLVPLFDDPSAAVRRDGDPDRELIWHFPYYHPEKKLFAESIDAIGIDDFAVSKTRPHSAIRSGHFKLLHFHEDDHVELYDLDLDPGEQQNLSEAEPETAARLAARLQRYLRSVGARFPERL